MEHVVTIHDLLIAGGIGFGVIIALYGLYYLLSAIGDALSR